MLKIRRQRREREREISNNTSNRVQSSALKTSEEKNNLEISGVSDTFHLPPDFNVEKENGGEEYDVHDDVILDNLSDCENNDVESRGE